MTSKLFIIKFDEFIMSQNNFYLTNEFYENELRLNSFLDNVFSHITNVVNSVWECC